MAQMHNTGPAVKLTFGICRVKRRNTNHREAFTNRIRKGVSRIQIRIENLM
jgi:hypothetical protein